jgi:hypothetical protein
MKVVTVINVITIKYFLSELNELKIMTIPLVILIGQSYLNLLN